MLSKAIVLGSAAVIILGACTDMGGIARGPGTKHFEALAGKKVYARVENVGDLTRACSQPDYQKAPFCAQPQNYVWVDALIGQKMLWHGASLAIPKEISPNVGDIVAYTAATDSRPWNTFEGIAARAQPPATSGQDSADNAQNNCDWSGPSAGWGGVVCNGWSYKENYPPLTHGYFLSSRSVPSTTP